MRPTTVVLIAQVAIALLTVVALVARGSSVGEAISPDSAAGLAPVELALLPSGPVVGGVVTHYGVSYNGQPLGCGDGPYRSGDFSVIAVGPARYSEWPCGTILMVCGPAGCLIGYRQDACPGCGPNHLDLTESGLAFVCGPQSGVCSVAIQELRLVTGSPSSP